MNVEEIEVGGTYFIRVKVASKDSDSVYCQLVDAAGNDRHTLSFYDWMLYSFLPVPPAPKYEPCRRFREGDIVTPIERYGREVPDGAPVGEKCTVVASEENGVVCIRYDAGSEHYIHEIPFYNLELVTPVEESEPYFVAYDDKFYHVHKKGEDAALAVYNEARHPHAKAAAEAECARLNAEHRKEQA